METSKHKTNFLKYLWEVSYLNRDKANTIPFFLGKIKILKNFSHTELYKLSRYLHLRHYGNDELIFKGDDEAVGFYFVFEGGVDIFVLRETVENENEIDKDVKSVEIEIGGRPYIKLSLLKKYCHFGEMGIFLEKSRRNVAAVARNETILLALLRPDLEMMIYDDPVIAAKILLSLGEVLASKIKQMVKMGNLGV